MLPILTIFWIGLLCLVENPVTGIDFINAVLPGYWFLKLFKFKPFSISMLLNWLHVITPLWLLSAYSKSRLRHYCIFSYLNFSSRCHDFRCFKPCPINSLRVSWLSFRSNASLKKPRMYLSILMARLVVSFSMSALSLLREVLGEYMGVKHDYLGKSMKFIRKTSYINTPEV